MLLQQLSATAFLTILQSYKEANIYFKNKNNNKTAAVIYEKTKAFKKNCSNILCFLMAVILHALNFYWDLIFCLRFLMHFLHVFLLFKKFLKFLATFKFIFCCCCWCSSVASGIVLYYVVAGKIFQVCQALTTYYVII